MICRWFSSRRKSNEDRIREAMSLGAKGYVRKPFRPEEIRTYLALKSWGIPMETTVATGDDGCDF